MRRSLLAALLATMLLAWPAQAQPTERVLLDMTLTTIPQAPTSVCPVLDAGHLAVTVKAVSEGQPRPVAFRLYGVRGIDPAADIDTTVGSAEATFTTPIKGGLYCLSLTNNAATSGPNAGLAELTNLRQDVAVKLVLTPQ